MDVKHDQPGGTIELILSDEDLEKFEKNNGLSARHPNTGQRVDVFKVSMMYNYGNDDPVRYPPVVSFGSDGLLNVAIPMRHSEELVLPLTIPVEVIQRGPATDEVFGKVGRIVLREASQSKTE